MNLTNPKPLNRSASHYESVCLTLQRFKDLFREFRFACSVCVNASILFSPHSAFITAAIVV